MNTTEITASGQMTTFNREGRTIYRVALSSSATAQFTAKSDHCVVVVEYDSSAANMGIQIPAGMAVGSVVEVYTNTSWNVGVKMPAGETVFVYDDTLINGHRGAKFTKVATDLWVSL